VQTALQTNLTATVNPDDLWGGRQLIEALQARARAVLNPLIPDGSSVGLLDYPNNSNVGDSLIWLGEIAYLGSRKIPIRYVSDIHNHKSDRLRQSLDKSSVILMHGGGNFGTLWPHEQAFRLKTLKEFAGIPVIQMPQSIHFGDDDVLEETRSAIQRHGNFTLVVRDKPSYDFAVAQFECKVFLCPDMAFFIGPIESGRNFTFDRFILSRTDHEKSGNWINDLAGLNPEVSVDVDDWLEQGVPEKILNRIQRHTAGFRAVADPSNQTLLKLWHALAKARMARGRELLERGRVVISDRLHVHILSILLNKPHILIDNSYGKLSSLHQAWTRPYEGVKFVNNLEEALVVAHQFDERLRQVNGRGGA